MLRSLRFALILLAIALACFMEPPDTHPHGSTPHNSYDASSVTSEALAPAHSSLGPWKTELKPKYMLLSHGDTTLRIPRNSKCKHVLSTILCHHSGCWICSTCGRIFEDQPPVCMPPRHVPGISPEICECGKTACPISEHHHEFVQFRETLVCRVCGLMSEAPVANDGPVPLQERDGHPQQSAYKTIAELEAAAKPISEHLQRFFSAVQILGHNSSGRSGESSGLDRESKPTYLKTGTQAYAHVLFQNVRTRGTIIQFASTGYP